MNESSNHKHKDYSSVRGTSTPGAPSEYVEPSYCPWCEYRGKNPKDVDQHIWNTHRCIQKPRYSCAKCFEKGYENQYKCGGNTFLEYIHINKNSVKRCFCGHIFARHDGISDMLNDMASEEYWRAMNSSVHEEEEERRKNI